MPDVILSYVVTTYNKLPYLKQVLNRLAQGIRSDEEIIVTDGGSQDGTSEYLQELLRQNKIQQFISEPDLGEGHGFNKAIFMSKGEVIKVITDDDAFYLPAIRKCKDLLLQHKEVDIICAQMGGLYTNTSETEIEFYETLNRKIKNHVSNRTQNFITSGIPLMIRRGAIPKLGLFSTTCKLVDNEYFHRISGIAKIGMVALPVAVRISNPQSVLVTISSEKYYSEVKRVDIMYGAEKLMELKDYSLLEILKSIFDRTRDTLRIRTRIKKIMGIKPPSNITDNSYQALSEEKIISIFNICHRWLEEKNQKASGTFNVLDNNT